MLASITPLGERGRHRRWGVTAAWYTAGSILGGATIGAAFGGIGSLWPQSTRPGGVVLVAVVAVAFALAAGIEVGLVPFRLPSLPRQVNENWLDTYRGWVVGLGFGYQLGLAVVTIITSAAVHVMLLLALLTFSVWGGLAVGAAFGLARSLPLLATWWVDSPARLRTVHVALESWAKPAHAVVAVVLLSMALVSVGVGA